MSSRWRRKRLRQLAIRLGWIDAALGQAMKRGDWLEAERLVELYKDQRGRLEEEKREHEAAREERRRRRRVAREEKR